MSVQNRYNLTERKSEPVLRYCEEHVLAFLPWYPMNAGYESGGYGLIAMRERIEALAGDLTVESRPGHGTAVRAEVPA